MENYFILPLKLQKKVLTVFVRTPNDGCTMGLEPTTSGTTNQRSNRLSYAHHLFLRMQK